MNFPNQALIDEPYILIKVISGHNLLIDSKDRLESDCGHSKERNNHHLLHPLYSSNQTKQCNEEDYKQQLMKQDTIKSEDDDFNSFLKVRNNYNSSNPYNISLSIHTPTTHLFETQSFKTFNGSIRFDYNKPSQRREIEYNELFQKEKTQSLNDLSASSKFIMHRRWKSNQPAHIPQTEKKIFLKDLSKYIMLDVVDSDCYMEKIIMSTQVLPVEYFSIPTNAGKKWQFWLRMNKYNQDQNNQQQAISQNADLYLSNQTIDRYASDKPQSADQQIERITGINCSNFEDYFVEIQPPTAYYLQSQHILDFRKDSGNETNTQVGTKSDLSNYSSKKGSPNNQQTKENDNLQDANQISKYVSDKRDVKDDQTEKLDKDYSWVQLDIIVMDIGSLLKLKANIISIEEIDRSGKPNLFYYNIVVTRNDGLTYLVKRRYKQFRDLKNQLQKNIKKIQFINFPQRSLSKLSSIFSKKSYLVYFEQAQSRKEHLQSFLDTIAHLDEVYRQQSFIQFFTSGGELDSERGFLHL